MTIQNKTTEDHLADWDRIMESAWDAAKIYSETEKLPECPYEDQIDRGAWSKEVRNLLNLSGFDMSEIA